MPRVRYTADGGRYRVGGTTFEPGDTAEVSDGLAEHLVEDVGDFEEIVDVDGGATTDEVEDGDGTADTGDEPDDGGDEDGLVATLRDMTVDEFEDELESGRFDDRLDEVAEAERQGKGRTGIQDAIGVRRAELEG